MVLPLLRRGGFLGLLLAILLSGIGFGSVAAGEVLKEPLDPGKPNTLSFAPIEARFVRLVILRTHGGQPCLDELEIYGPGAKDNLALASRGSKATASSCLEGHAIHQIGHLNDGLYGNAHSWIAADTEGWAQIELPQPAVIDRVVISRDREGHFHDRMPAALEVRVSLDGAQWKIVRSIESGPPRGAAAAVTRALLPIDRPARGETAPDWAARIVARLTTSLHKEGQARRQQLHTLDDARAMLDLVSLE